MKVLTLKDLNKKANRYFMLVDENGKSGKAVWCYDYWDVASRSYCCHKYDDANSWKLFKPTQKITIDLEF